MPAATIREITIVGVITDSFGKPVNNTKVKAFDKALRSETPLGEAMTNAAGEYSISYNSLSPILQEYKTADIFIRVVNERNEILGESEIIFNAKPNTRIDLAINIGDEFSNLIKLIQTFAFDEKSKPIAFKDLKEDNKNSDISFLAGETDESFEKIVAIKTSFSFSDETHIEPDIFYGLFRMGFPMVLNELLFIKAESIKKALQHAMDENVISSKWQKKLDDIIKSFNSLSVSKVVDGTNDRSVAFKKLFGSALSTDQQKIFTATYFDSENAPEKFWDKLKQQPGFNDGAVVEKTKQLLSLNLLTNNQHELAQHLFSKQSSDPDLKEMSGYAKFSKADWQQQITSAAVTKFPAWVKGTNTDGKTEHYAESLEQLHKQLYPTAFFAARMKQDGQSAFSFREQLNIFFSKNPGFELNTKNIKKQFEQASFENINDKEAIKKELKTLNRLYKLTDDYKQVNELYSKQLFSSADIVKNYGGEKFVKEFAGISGGDANAALLYKKAVSVNNKTTALITGYKTRHDVKVYAIDGDNDAPEGYHEMFADRELCECEHCQSVYSPSAYFVDMLAFIKRQNEIAFNELLRRRPDLEHILLTCKNTNTPLPYIDLVNELLEKQVLQLSGMTEIEGVPLGTHSYQTEGTAANLIAKPEHINNDAYEPQKTITDTSVFSEFLPLDLPLEEIRAYSEKLGWKRYELMDAFYGNNVPGKMQDANLAAELFGFSDAELKIINGVNAFALTLPGTVIEVLEKTKLSYIELLQLLETHFLNKPAADGIRPVRIEQIAGIVPGEEPLLTCNLEKLKLTGASNEWLNKAIRFARLWKKLPWDIFDLDRTLTVLGIEDFPATDTAINEQLLVPVAHIEKIKRLLNIQLRQVVTFFGNIDTATYLDHTKEGQPPLVSLYDELFRSAVVNDASIVCAALGISAAEYTSLQTREDFSLPSLSSIYRYVLLSRSLRISTPELKEVINFTGNQTRALAWTPEILSEFLAQWQVFKSAGIKTVEFKACFNAVPDEEYTIPVDYKLIKSVSDCTSELVAINNNSAITEEERKVRFVERTTEVLQVLANNTALNAALSAPLSNPADIALKTVVDNYLGEKNQGILSSLSAGEMILKLEALGKSLYDYIVIVLKKAPSIFDKLKFQPVETLWLKNNKELLGIGIVWGATVDFENDSFFKAFSKLYYLSAWAKTRSSTLSWIGLLEIAIVNGENAKAGWFQSFISLHNVSETSIEFLCGSKDEVNNKGRLNFSFPTDYINAENILTILNCCRIIEKLGGNAAQLRGLLSKNVLPEETLLAESLLKSKYGINEWLDVIKPIKDRLRTRRRNALVSWLLANTNIVAWHSANDLYEWLLIDTEMDACMVTSRIKQGISSIQLFIDRCLMNLESGISLSKDFADQWHTWRKQYRVWEANRKIFLYPENWIEPELRDDKSPFFKELESQLKQNEVTKETAKEALITYLQKLDTVANLEMVGLFNDDETKIVYVFGRTQNIPHQYFYRKQEDNVWTAWEKVEVDIEGDHILPVVWNGRLMLFWAKFTAKQEQSGGSTTIKKPDDDGNMNFSSTPAVTYLEMKLAWSEYKNGKWSSKKISKEIWSSQEPYMGNPPDKYISLDSEILDGKLEIKLFRSSDRPTNQILRSGIIFEFDSCNSYPKRKQHPYSWEGKYTPINTAVDKMKIVSTDVNHQFAVSENGFYTRENLSTSPIVLKTSKQFEVLPSHHERLNQKPLLFFYSDNKDTFYVVSNEKIRPVSGTEVLANAALLLARKVVENPGRAIDTGAINGREHSNASIPVLVTSELETTFSSIEVNTYWVFQGKKYLFQTFYHPFVCAYIKMLNSMGINALYEKNIQNKDPETIFTTTEYAPTDLVLVPYPKKEVDFSYTGSYSIFNWELFYHIPMLIATRLTQNQKFEEARKWFHYIFDPTRSSGTETDAERFWITRPFRKEIADGILSLEDLLNKEEHADELDVQLTNWEQNPFNPHAVARLRISAYLRNTVLRYIDNLIQWGDQLFRRDTIESINEATLLYILAANILGKKQEVVPARGKPVEKSFSGIKEKLDRFGNVKAEIETFFSPSSGDDNILMPYFCLPKNDYLLKYWDTVADRLFKIRHCMNIEGVVRQLPLFEPPLDPGLLMRAKDAGLDLNTILEDISISLPNYRFPVMLQKANELSNDVKSLGNSLLSALEKRGGEELALMRSTHELKMLEVIKEIKERQRNEANENLNSLQVSRLVVEERLAYFNNNASDYLNPSERTYFNLTNQAIGIQKILELKNYLSSIAALTPNFKIGSGFTIGTTFGGENLERAEAAAGNALQSVATLNRLQAESANMKGGYDRRMDEWKFQSKSADLELKQIDKQILAAEIRLAIADKELENHDLQMEQLREVDDYMRRKFTNEELYDYMAGQLSNVYFQSYQLAYTTAKKAEKCLQHELGLNDTSYIQFGYWDSLKKGLLSGEKLQYDLRRLENAYLEKNKREHEIVKHVSLVMLDPLALLQLRSTGSCEFEISEVLYLMDHPYHYFQRLKSVSVSLCCITGSQTSISAKLSLVKSKYRFDKSTEPEFEESPAGIDTRFVYLDGPIQTIATSNAQNDSGIFELNFRDERYLPFEGMGAISNWKLELPSIIRQFDYNSISDVVIHIKYTARDGGDSFRGKANENLKELTNNIRQLFSEKGLHTAINLKHDLPNEWHQLKQNGQVNIKIDKTRLPYLAQSLDVKIENCKLVARMKNNDLATLNVKINEGNYDLKKVFEDEIEWQYLLASENISEIKFAENFSLSIDDINKPKIEEMILIVKYVLL